MSDHWSKVNFDLKKLIYGHCLIRYYISSENNDFGFSSFLKETIPFKCIGKQS